MKLARILLASVLKPADDVRMFGKIAMSLSNQYDVHTCGQPQTSLSHEWVSCTVHFHPVFRFGRGQPGRLRANFILWRMLRELSPDLLVVHAVELLPCALLYRLRFGRPIIYDIRENYVQNILRQGYYSPVIRHLLAASIRLTEWICAPWISHFLLAERCYLQELPFLKGRATVLENKAIRYPGLHPLVRTPKTDGWIFALTGTLSEAFGAMEAVEFVRTLQQKGYRATLLVCGVAASENVAGTIETFATEGGALIACGSCRQPAPHRAVMEVLSQADFGLLPYRPTGSAANRIPTRLYECLSLHTPVVFQKNALWEEICAPYPAGLSVDFSCPEEAIGIFLDGAGRAFYQQPTGSFPLWEEEVNLLQACIQQVLQKA